MLLVNLEENERVYQLQALPASGHTIRRIIYGSSNEGQNMEQATSLLDHCEVRVGGKGGSCRTLWYSLVLASDGAWFVARRLSSVWRGRMLWDRSVSTALYTPSCPSVTATNMTSDDVVGIHAMAMTCHPSKYTCVYYVTSCCS